MKLRLLLFLMLLIVTPSRLLLCFNCSSEQQDSNRCAGEFAYPMLPFNATKAFVVNCTEDNAMCFVRSWSSRIRRAWIVQRGCYQPLGDDTFPSSMSIPTRAMTCKQERRPNAEYKVCICQADWCNFVSKTRHMPTFLLNLWWTLYSVLML